MVKARKINVVDLNEIRSADTHAATHVEAAEPTEETVDTPEPVEEPEVTPEVHETKQPEVMRKCDEKATCAFCNKVMSVKSLRYSHDKNCKGKAPPAAPDPAARPKSPERVEETPKAQKVMKMTKGEMRQHRLNSLVSQAF